MTEALQTTSSTHAPEAVARTTRAPQRALLRPAAFRPPAPRASGPRKQVALRAAADLAGLGSAVVLLVGVLQAPFAPGALLALPLTLVVFALYGLYDASRIGAVSAELRRLAQAVTVAAALTAILLLPVAPRAWVIGMWAAGLVATGASRLVARRLGRAITQAGVIVVGTGDSARAVAGPLLRRRWTGYEPVGFVSTDQNTFGKVDGLPILGPLDEIHRVVQDTRARAVVIADPSLRADRIEGIRRSLQTSGVDLWVAPPLASLAAWRLRVDTLDGMALLGLSGARRRPLQAAGKRLLDVAGSASLLMLLAPLFAVIAVAVKASDRGPALFRQVRVGQHGRRFLLFKFRTMRPDAEDWLADLRQSNEADGVLFKLHDDPRVTRLGKVLRRFSLDELPQLWNVLRGDMSLVGPRPALPEETENYQGRLQDRLLVKPGLTGLWQVNGRHRLSFAAYVHYDLFYAENWSVGLDVCLLARTLPAVVSGDGSW